MKEKKILKLLTPILMIMGITGCTVIYKGDPQWDPAILSKEGCPNIDGKYRDRDLLSRQFIQDVAPPEGETIPMTTQGYRLPPNQEAANQAQTLIRQQGRQIEITRMSPAGERYSQTLLNMDHPWIGCYKGALILRKWTLLQGADFECGSSSASDREIRRLPDGTLEVKYRSREWRCSMSKEPIRKSGVLLFPPVK